MIRYCEPVTLIKLLASAKFSAVASFNSDWNVRHTTEIYKCKYCMKFMKLNTTRTCSTRNDQSTKQFTAQVIPTI